MGREYFSSPPLHPKTPKKARPDGVCNRASKINALNYIVGVETIN